MGNCLQHDPRNHQWQNRNGKFWSPETGVFESGECLVGKAHDKETYKAKDHRVTVCQYPRVVYGAEIVV